MKHEIKQSVWLANLAYQEPETIFAALADHGYKNFDWVDEPVTDTQAILCTHGQDVFISIRGTEFDNTDNIKKKFDLDDLNTDLDIYKIPVTLGKCHRGFFTAATDIAEPVREYIAGGDGVEKIHIGGHSLGAGVALALTLILEKFDSLTLVGAPRVLDREAARRFGELHKDKCFRIVNNNDVVTRIPPRLFNFRHIPSKLFYFKESGECVNDISWWDRFKDRVHGRLADIGEWGTDGLKDHSVSKYWELVNGFELDTDANLVTYESETVNSFIILTSPSIATSIVDLSPIVPEMIILKQNYPNPFNPQTNIEFLISNRSNVKLNIYNILGQNVFQFNKTQMDAGTHVVQFGGSSFASGIYFYELLIDGKSVGVKKMSLIR